MRKSKLNIVLNRKVQRIIGKKSKMTKRMTKVMISSIVMNFKSLYFSYITK